MTHKPPVSRNMRIAQWTIPVLLLAILGINSYGPVQKQLRAAELTSAIGYYKQIYVALYSYAKDHDGIYPIDSENESPTAAACFDKLIHAGKVSDEEFFWNKQNALTLGTASISPPNNTSPFTENENTAGYVMGLTELSRSKLPILFDSSTKAGVFNTSVWEGRAIVAKLNGSVAAMRISQIRNSPNQHNDGYIL